MTEMEYLSHTEVFSDAILVAYPLRGALAKNARACGTRCHNVC